MYGNMKSKKKYLKYKKERVILSDVLPYETPIIFSNRYFYDFLLTHKVHFLDNNIKWQDDDEALEKIIRILFGVGLDTEVISSKEYYLNKKIKLSTFKKPTNNDPDKQKKTWSFVSKPFVYKISHKEKEHRELTICHPRNQLQLVDFHHRYKELILYYCSMSPFSLRIPHKIAKFIYYKDKTHHQRLSKEDSIVEEFDKEYENLKSFFVYKDYSNIYKFYESYKFHRCEKKYNELMKLDISSCFDSIYTHSLAWALIDKRTVKENLTVLNGTFADKFDRLMQNLNYQETNGIVIGPEFSRIFAELILQHVDKTLSIRLKKNHGLVHKIHYEIFRYVDDYFIFYNDDSTKEIIQEELQVYLREYKLSLNSAKADTYKKPIITEISIAKQSIAELLNDKLKYRFEEIGKHEEDGDEQKWEAYEKELQQNKKGNIYVNSNKLITMFKTIIKKCDVEYKDVLNYSLSIVERKSAKIVSDFYTLIPDEKYEKNIVQAILNILDFSFFIYSVSPRVNTTIKLCRILKIYCDFLKRNGANVDFRHLVFKSIYDNTLFIMKKNKNCEHTQVETLYLLVALSELGKDYWLEESTLCYYFDIEKSNTLEYSSHSSLNYFSLTILIFYMKNKKRYDDLRMFIESKICSKYDKNMDYLKKDTELTLLFFDMLTCPYISKDTKRTLLKKYGISDTNLQDDIICKRKYWFMKWTDFDFAKELDAKRSSEVY